MQSQFSRKDVNKNLGNGNTLAQQGSYTKKDGTTAQAGDSLLAADKPAQPPHGQNAIH